MKLVYRSEQILTYYILFFNGKINKVAVKLPPLYQIFVYILCEQVTTCFVLHRFTERNLKKKT